MKIWTFVWLDDSMDCWENKGYWATKELAMRDVAAMGYNIEFCKHAFHEIEVIEK